MRESKLKGEIHLPGTVPQFRVARALVCVSILLCVSSRDGQAQDQTIVHQKQQQELKYPLSRHSDHTTRASSFPADQVVLKRTATVEAYESGEAALSSEGSAGSTDPAIWWQQEMHRPVLTTTGGNFVLASLDSLILSALQNSQRIRIARIDTFVEQETVTQQKAQFDWTAFTRSLFTNTNQQTGSDLDAGAGVARLIQQNLSNDLGVRRRNVYGGNFEATQNLQLLDSNSEFIDPNEQGFTQLTLRYNQPLLGDGGYLVNYGQVLLAENTAAVTFEESQARIAEIVVEVSQAYWELYRLRSRIVVQKSLVYQIQTLLNDVQKRKKIDATRSLLGQTESDLATQQATLAATAIQLQQAQFRLARVVGDRSLSEFAEVIPLDSTPPIEAALEPQSALVTALQFRPELRAAANRITGSEITRQISLRQLLPRLALVLETSVNAVNGNFGVGRSLGDQFSEGGPSYVVGFNYEIPLGNRADRSRLRQTEYLLAREVAQLEDTVDQVRLEVSNAVAALTGATDQFSIRKLSSTKAQEVVDGLLKRRELFPDEIDRISQLFLREILDAQQRKSQADFALIDLISEYASTVIQLRQATGTLLSHHDTTTFLPPVECGQSALERTGTQRTTTAVGPLRYNLDGVQVEPAATADESANEAGDQASIELIHAELPSAELTSFFSSDSSSIQWAQLISEQESFDRASVERRASQLPLSHRHTNERAPVGAATDPGKRSRYPLYSGR